jgi:hypothetical protein
MLQTGALLQQAAPSLLMVNLNAARYVMEERASACTIIQGCTVCCSACADGRFSSTTQPKCQQLCTDSSCAYKKLILAKRAACSYDSQAYHGVYC